MLDAKRLAEAVATLSAPERAAFEAMLDKVDAINERVIAIEQILKDREAAAADTPTPAKPET